MKNKHLLLLLIFVVICSVVRLQSLAARTEKMAADAAVVKEYPRKDNGLHSSSTIVSLRQGENGYAGTSDAYVTNAEPSSPHDNRGIEVLEKGGLYGTKRGLMRFDVTSIPHYMEVTEASLELYVYYRAPEDECSISLYHLLKSWDEAAVTWNTTGYEDWSSPGFGAVGVDREGDPFASTTVMTSNDWASFDVTAAVQRWVEDPTSNHGFAMMGHERVDVRFWNSEYSLAFRPRLVVTYEVPPDITPPPTYTLTPTNTPTLAPSPTPSPANLVYSWGDYEAFGQDCYEAYGSRNACCTEVFPGAPNSANVLLAYEGVATSASLRFLHANDSGRSQAIHLNGQEIGRLQERNDSGKCNDDMATEEEFAFDPSLVRQGLNEITIYGDAEPMDPSGWSMQNPQIELGGALQAPDIEIIELTSSFDDSARRAMIQKPIDYDPDGGGPYPLVIAIHHWGGHDFDALKDFAVACNDQGWLLACPDIRRDRNVADQFVQSDIIDLLEHMVDEYAADPERVYIQGISMGGMMAATTAAKYPDRFAALCEMQGPTNLKDWYYQLGEMIDQEWRQEKIEEQRNGTPTTNRFAYQSVSAAEMAVNLAHMPTMIVHGLNDELVPYSHAENLRDAMENAGAEEVAFYPFEGGHGDSSPEGEPASVLDFFDGRSRVTCPLTVTVRTPESKSYYWLDISYDVAEHWTSATAWYDPQTEVIELDIVDEDDKEVDVAFDLVKMGLPTNSTYTVEDYNVRTGEFEQESVSATDSLVFHVTPGRHRIVASPSTASEPETLILRQGEGGYTGVADTYIVRWEDNGNHGGEQGLRLSGGGDRTCLLRFDLSEVPSNVVVKAAQLKLYANLKWNPQDEVGTNVYRLLQGWSVDEVTWAERLLGVPWTQGGASAPDMDYDPQSYASQQLQDTKTWYDYNVTDLVRDWLAHPGSNHGLMLRGDTGRGTFTLNSSESLQHKPGLVVVYAYPTPTPSPTRTSVPTATPSPTRRDVGYLPLILKVVP